MLAENAENNNNSNNKKEMQQQMLKTVAATRSWQQLNNEKRCKLFTNFWPFLAFAINTKREAIARPDQTQTKYTI